MVGGLGVRVTQLAEALAEDDVATDLYFVGAPDRERVEQRSDRLRLHRCAQGISIRFPGGVYDGEDEKLIEFANAVPPAVCADVASARNRGEHVLIIGEDWQIAPAIVQLDADLRRWGLRESATLLWNANNTYGFHRIDWHALTRAARVTAVSKYMKFELSLRGISSLVISNGIPARLLRQYDPDAVRTLHDVFGTQRTLLKVGRFDPDKNWIQAIDATAELRDAGMPVRLIMRGGRESYRNVVTDRIRERGLRFDGVIVGEGTPEELARALSSMDADVVEIRSFLPNATLYALYGAVDGVLANSGREPFGLVGLEVMALHGIPVCGSTGEDYAHPFENAIVCDTDDPRELSSYLRMSFSDPSIAERIRKNARATAERFTWPAILEILSAKLGF
jgi:glycosyltransferase involved in cell wall biosynthesis